MTTPTQNKVYTKDAWADFIVHMSTGETLEIDQDIYEYTLGVLPPVFMGKTIKGQRCAFGFAEGEETITGFWREGTRFFCQNTGIMNRPGNNLVDSTQGGAA